MKLFNRYQLLTLFFFVSFSLHSAATNDTLINGFPHYIIEDNYPIQALDGYTSMINDDEEIWTIEDILNREQQVQFSPFQDSVINGQHTIWMRVGLHANVTIKDWWIMAHRGRKVTRFLTRHDRTEVYFVKDGHVLTTALTGSKVPGRQKDISELHTINRVYANFEKGETIQVYFRVKATEFIASGLELRDPSIGLPDPNGHPGFMNVRAIQSFSLILGIYVFIFFFFTNDISYLYLCGMLIFEYLHYFLLLPYFPLIEWCCINQPSLYTPFWKILTTGSFLFFFQFGRTFTNLKEISPKWDRYTLYIICAALGSLFFELVLWMISPDTFPFLSYATALISFVPGLAILIRLAFINILLVRYFVFAGLWLVTFSIIGVLWEMDIIPFFSNPNPWMISRVGFMLINAIAIARKIQISERAQAEVIRIKEIDSVKSKFFANISHEFRTPLTLILGPVNQSLEAIPLSDEVEDDMEVPVKSKYLKIMRRSALRLQQLVNQVLDLSKLDQGKLTLQVQEKDVIKYIRSLVFSFESLAERRHINYKTHFPKQIELSYFDPDKLEKILVNLLSNAFKFTPDNGSISIAVEDKGSKLHISISDSGKGMDTSDMDKIFDRFYQVEGTEAKGTGIGLALVKELVTLHNGHIVVDSVIGEGTTIKVVIPYKLEDLPADVIIGKSDANEVKTRVELSMEDDQMILNEQVSNFENNDQPVVLIVEDNPDLRDYVNDQLKEKYNTLLAKDGEEGEEIARAKTPDLIVSDVMMPKKNGFDLCQSLKKDTKTSHIPIILLTAKADRQHKLEGLKFGADDYLTKPFDKKELDIRISNLLNQRQRLREHYGNQLQIRPSNIKATSLDDRFVKDVMSRIEENMDNEFFTVEELAQKVGFSRSQLARKIKAITGKTSNQLIREFRLIRAKELLEQHSASVSEIAYQVGYSNLSYFSKSYKELFGILPRET